MKKKRLPPWTPFVESSFSSDPATHQRLLAAVGADKVYVNSRYQVSVKVTTIGTAPAAYLSIKRRDKRPIHDWRDLQRIKSEICGAECEGFEVYPAESQLIDESNQYHMWVFTDGVPRLGFRQGRQTATPEQAAEVGARQRPWSPEHCYHEE